MTGHTDTLAAFSTRLHRADLPDTVATRMAQCLLDFIGNATAAHTADSAQPLHESLQQLNGPEPGTATVVGAPTRYRSEYAALYNGALAHTLDFDDTNIAAALHPGASVIPAAIAVGEQTGSTGADLLTALAAGYEVCSRIGVALGRGAYERGFHPTSVAGIFGAVAAGAILQRLDTQTLSAAWGLAGSMAAGSMQYLENGSWNKRLHPGLAAHNALLGLNLARAGFVGAIAALEGPYGVLNAYSVDANPEPLVESLGDQWVCAQTGLKPYPSCRLTHGAIDAALALRTHKHYHGPASASLDIGLSPTAHTIVGQDVDHKRHPNSSVDAQFSVYFTTTAALLEGRFAWASYQRTADSHINDLVNRVTVHTDDALPSAGATLTYKCGDTVITIRREQPSGEPDDIDWPLVEGKFHTQTSATFTGRQREQIARTIREMDHATVHKLTALLRTEPR